MEDIPRDMDREIEAGPSGTDFSRRTRRWDILIVKDDGKVISVPWFKKIIYTVLFLFSLVILVSLTLLVMYRTVLSEKRELLASLERTMERTLILQADIDQKVDELEAMAEKQRENDPADFSMNTMGGRETIHMEPEEKPPGADAKSEAQKNDMAVESLSGGAGEEKTVLSPGKNEEGATLPANYKVEIDDFSATRKAQNHSLKIWFVLKNISEKAETLSGNIFVVLKPDGRNEKDWLVYPPSPLVSGRPEKSGMGQNFSIRKFKTVRFIVTDPIDYTTIKSATVFVYSESGTLILEQDYVLNIAMQ